MSSITQEPDLVTLADLLERLGGIAPSRVRMRPLLGTATEEDLIELNDRKEGIYELIDGVLVQKVKRFLDSTLNVQIIFLLKTFLTENDLGLIADPSGGVRPLPGVVRMPDISFVSWDRLPAREVPDVDILDMAPDLAVEVLSPSNTEGEIDLKIRHFFLGGTRLVWVVDSGKRTARVYTAPDQSRTLRESQSLDGGDVLPGLSLPLRQIFARLPPRPARRAKRPPRA